jgi:hypothetical protein
LRSVQAGDLQVLRRFWLLPLAAVLVLTLWYGAAFVWARVLRRMAQSVSTWEELDESDMAECATSDAA